jgi:lactoylglutathione lyase
MLTGGGFNHFIEWSRFMHIEHIALWTSQMERMKDFYEKYFQASTGKMYQNLSKGFESCFLSFSTGARLELMQQADRQEIVIQEGDVYHGYAHISWGAGSVQAVDELTEQLRRDGYQVLRDPRYTGDGYYESVISDPDGNQVEITV